MFLYGELNQLFAKMGSQYADRITPSFLQPLNGCGETSQPAQSGRVLSRIA